MLVGQPDEISVGTDHVSVSRAIYLTVVPRDERGRFFKKLHRRHS
jgi:hypothetical protein